MKRIVISLLLSLVLVSCGGFKTLRHVSVGHVGSVNVTSVGLGGGHATVDMELVNNSTKSITFVEAQVDLLVNQEPIGRVVINQEITLQPGVSTQSVPVKFNVSLRSAARLLFNNASDSKELEYRLRGSFEVAKGDDKAKTVKFNRVINQKTAERIMTHFK